MEGLGEKGSAAAGVALPTTALNTALRSSVQVSDEISWCAIGIGADMDLDVVIGHIGRDRQDHLRCHVDCATRGSVTPGDRSQHWIRAAERGRARMDVNRDRFAHRVVDLDGEPDLRLACVEGDRRTPRGRTLARLQISAASSSIATTTCLVCCPGLNTSVPDACR